MSDHRMKHRISVILPTYNRAHLVGETIQSLLEQTRMPDEILVIDDGSQDETPQVLAQHDGLRVVRTGNKGKASALNLALSLVSGDLVWIVDDDDLLLSHACMALSGPLEADQELDFCAGRHLDFEVDEGTGEKIIRPPGYMRDSPPGQIFPDLLEGCHVFQPGLMVRKRVYDAAGPFDTSLVRSQDYDMILRIARHHRGLQLPDTVFLHREHQGRRGTATDNFDAAENADRWAAFNQRIIVPLLHDLADDELLAKDDIQRLPGALRGRAARVKRGCVLARHRMWPEAIAAWCEAAAMETAPLTRLERNILARSPNSTLGAPELFEDGDVRSALTALSRMAFPGPKMAAIVRRSARWHVRAALRQGDWRRAAQGVHLLLAR